MAKMREGSCRTTKSGQKYCKTDGQVRFVPKTGRRRVTALASPGRKSRKRRGKCKRFKRVRSATGKLVRRCAKF